jgi:hypothetical protein
LVEAETSRAEDDAENEKALEKIEADKKILIQAGKDADDAAEKKKEDDKARDDKIAEEKEEREKKAKEAREKK